MKLSDLSSNDVTLISAANDDDSSGAPLKLSTLKPGDAQLVQAAQPNSSSDGIVKSAINSLPMVGGVAGGILGTPMDAISGPAGNFAGATIGGYLGTAAKNLINSYYDPDSAPKTASDSVISAAKGGAEQGLAQGAGELATPIIAKGAKAIAGPVSDYIGSYAANKAIAATGATGRQALNFAPGAGQELLDQGIVSFGNAQAKISQKASDALEAAGNKISSTLADLDNRGATVDQADIVNSLRKRATELGDDPSQYGVSDSLNRLADRIQSTVEAKGGNSEIPLTTAENTKRGFQASANYNSSPIDLSISKEAAGIYQKAVEDAATKFDPKSADVFKEAKKTYGLLSPIQEAAEKRASTLNQSPAGGLLDTDALLAGDVIGGPIGAVVAPIARRVIAPRIPAMTATTANFAGNAIRGIPSVAEQAAPAAIQPITHSFMNPPSAVSPSSFIELPAAAQSNPSGNQNVVQGKPINRSPAKGPDAWAQQGIQKLGISGSMATQLLNDPKGKQLLIQASDLTPNSKAMKNIMSQISKRWGQ